MRKSAFCGYASGCSLTHRGVHRAQLGARRLEVGARREPAEQLGHPVHAAVTIVAVEMVRARDDVGDDLGFRRIGHRRLEDADDRRRPFAEPHRLADHRSGRSCKRGGPEPMCQHRGARRPSGRRRSVRAGGRSTGRRPMTSKYEPPTTPARTTRGSPRPTIVKSIVEKSPKAVSVLTRARRSLDLRDRELGVLGCRCPGRSGGCRSADPRRG